MFCDNILRNLSEHIQALLAPGLDNDAIPLLEFELTLEERISRAWNLGLGYWPRQSAPGVGSGVVDEDTYDLRCRTDRQLDLLVVNRHSEEPELHIDNLYIASLERGESPQTYLIHFTFDQCDMRLPHWAIESILTLD